MANCYANYIDERKAPFWIFMLQQQNIWNIKLTHTKFLNSSLILGFFTINALEKRTVHLWNLYCMYI